MAAFELAGALYPNELKPPRPATPGMPPKPDGGSFYAEGLSKGEIDDTGFIKLVASSAPSTGYCNTMGTASSVAIMVEVLGLTLSGTATIPEGKPERYKAAFDTGKEIVNFVNNLYEIQSQFIEAAVEKSGYKEGCADTIEMYEWLTTNDHDYQQAIKNNKILDMFIDRE